MKKRLHFLKVEDVVEKLEILKEKNRDLLTIEDANVLDDCIEGLKSIGYNPESDAVIWLRVCTTLLKWLTESDVF